MTKPARIQAIGTAVPANKISQSRHYSILENANGMSREEKLTMRKMYMNSGIDFRYSVLDEFGKAEQPTNILFHPSNHHPAIPVSQRMNLFEKHSIKLTAHAVNDCFAQLPSISPSQITHLITFSCTGMSAPGLDMQLVEKIGLPLNVERTCINFMGCYAGINALKSAYHITRSQPGSIVLLAGVELCTLHYQKAETLDRVIANALFGDGAAAAIVSSELLHPGNNSRNLSLENFYSEFDASGKNEMVWRIGDFGFDLRLSAYVPALIKNGIYDLMEKHFKCAQLKQTDIDFYAMHPGGKKILEACEQALNITKEQNAISYHVLREFGNMSSVTILFVLKEYMKSFRKEDKGKNMFACAFGPGLTMETMLLEIS